MHKNDKNKILNKYIYIIKNTLNEIHKYDFFLLIFIV